MRSRKVSSCAGPEAVEIEDAPRPCFAHGELLSERGEPPFARDQGVSLRQRADGGVEPPALDLRERRGIGPLDRDPQAGDSFLLARRQALATLAAAPATSRTNTAVRADAAVAVGCLRIHRARTRVPRIAIRGDGLIGQETLHVSDQIGHLRVALVDLGAAHARAAMALSGRSTAGFRS